MIHLLFSKHYDLISYKHNQILWNAISFILLEMQQGYLCESILFIVLTFIVLPTEKLHIMTIVRITVLQNKSTKHWKALLGICQPKVLHLHSASTCYPHPVAQLMNMIYLSRGEVTDHRTWYTPLNIQSTAMSAWWWMTETLEDGIR